MQGSPILITLQNHDKIAILDIETTEQIPEDRNITSLNISYAGILIGNKTHFFDEHNVAELFKILDSSDLIVGHNLFAFDYKVLQRYADFDIAARYKEKTYDIFRILERKTGYRISLNDLAERNLGEKKTEKGIDAPKLYKDGDLARLKDYLAQDLHLTMLLFIHIAEKKALKYGANNYKTTFERTVEITLDDR